MSYVPTWYTNAIVLRTDCFFFLCGAQEKKRSEHETKQPRQPVEVAGEKKPDSSTVTDEVGLRYTFPGRLSRLFQIPIEDPHTELHSQHR